MTWVKNFRALLLTLIAVAAVAVLVVSLVENVQMDRQWHNFVQETARHVEVAEQSLEEATELADLGERVGVAKADLMPLHDQIEECGNMLAELRGLEQYVVEDDVHALPDEEDSAATDTTLVDPYGVPDITTVPLILPPSSRAIMAEYGAITDSLAESLGELAVVTQQVSLAIGSHTGELVADVSLAREALTYQVIRGQLLMEYALNQSLSDSELDELREAVDQGQAVQLEHRILDKDDPILLAKALDEMEAATTAIRTAVLGLVDKLDVNPDELLDLITPDELWDDNYWMPPAVPEAGGGDMGDTWDTETPDPPTVPETENPNTGTPETPDPDLPGPPPETEEPEEEGSEAGDVADQLGELSAGGAPARGDSTL